MRKLILTIVLALAAAGAQAQEDKALAQPAPAKDTKELTGVVLATDITSKTITVKKETDPMLSELQPEKTLAVDAKAEASLKSVKVGDKVRLVLKSDPAGKEVVSNIEKPEVGAPEKQ